MELFRKSSLKNIRQNSQQINRRQTSDVLDISCIQKINNSQRGSLYNQLQPLLDNKDCINQNQHSYTIINQCQEQYQLAMELRIKKDQQSKLNALKILQRLFQKKIMSFQTNERNYQLKQNIILNYWKLMEQVEKNKTKILQILRISYLYLKKQMKLVKPKKNNIHLLLLILAKQQYNVSKYKQALTYLDQSLLYLKQGYQINSQLLKIHYMKTRIYNKLQDIKSQLDQIQKCLFFLKTINMTTNKVGNQLHQNLLLRKQELLKLIKRPTITKNTPISTFKSVESVHTSHRKLKNMLIPTYQQLQINNQKIAIDNRNPPKTLRKNINKRTKSASLSKINQVNCIDIFQQTQKKINKINKYHLISNDKQTLTTKFMKSQKVKKLKRKPIGFDTMERYCKDKQSQLDILTKQLENIKLNNNNNSKLKINYQHFLLKRPNNTNKNDNLIDQKYFNQNKQIQQNQQHSQQSFNNQSCINFRKIDQCIKQCTINVQKQFIQRYIQKKNQNQLIKNLGYSQYQNQDSFWSASSQDKLKQSHQQLQVYYNSQQISPQQDQKIRRLNLFPTLQIQLPQTYINQKIGKIKAKKVIIQQIPIQRQQHNLLLIFKSSLKHQDLYKQYLSQQSRLEAYNNSYINKYSQLILDFSLDLVQILSLNQYSKIFFQFRIQLNQQDFIKENIQNKEVLKINRKKILERLIFNQNIYIDVSNDINIVPVVKLLLQKYLNVEKNINGNKFVFINNTTVKDQSKISKKDNQFMTGNFPNIFTDFQYKNFSQQINKNSLKFTRLYQQYKETIKYLQLWKNTILVKCLPFNVPIHQYPYILLNENFSQVIFQVIKLQNIIKYRKIIRKILIQHTYYQNSQINIIDQDQYNLPSNRISIIQQPRQINQFYQRSLEKQLADYFIERYSDQSGYYQKITQQNQFYYNMKLYLLSQHLQTNSIKILFNINTMLHLIKINNKKFIIKIHQYISKYKKQKQFNRFYKFQIVQKLVRTKLNKFILTNIDLNNIIKNYNSNIQLIQIVQLISKKFILKKQLLYYRVGLNCQDQIYYLRNKFNSISNYQYISNNQINNSYLSQSLKTLQILLQTTIKIKLSNKYFYTILTAMKIKLSKIIIISLYIPIISRTYSFRINHNILNYLHPNQLHYLFSNIISNYQQYDINQLVLMLFNQDFNFFQVNQLWKNFIDLIIFQEYSTQISKHTLVIIGSYNAFLKDSTISQYVYHQESVSLIEFSFEEKQSSLSIIPNKGIEQSYSTILKSYKPFRSPTRVSDNLPRSKFYLRQNQIQSKIKQQSSLSQIKNIYESKIANYIIYTNITNVYNQKQINSSYYLSDIIPIKKKKNNHQNFYQSNNQFNQHIYRYWEIIKYLKILKLKIINQIKNKSQINLYSIINKNKQSIKRVTLNCLKSQKDNYLSNQLILINKTIITKNIISCIFYDQESKLFRFYISASLNNNIHLSRQEKVVPIIGHPYPLIQQFKKFDFQNINKRIVKYHKNYILFN